MDSYNVIGIMSGTSLDGLDICYANFQLQSNWSFNIKIAETISIPQKLKIQLKSATSLSGLDLSLLNNYVGDFIGKSINQFIDSNNINKKEIDFISSHGHTIFHQPEKQLTLQIGNGANISALTKLPVVCDFRTTDLALKGNGAPLVPIGDKLLFSKFDYCINLGGISNISYDEYNKMTNNFGNRVAFDICPVNIVLNKLANQKGLDYDENGNLAKQGTRNDLLLEKLSLLPYYQEPAPKSLGLEWIEKNIYPILDSSNISIEDKLNTFYIHIAQQIRHYLYSQEKRVLFTGGGTHNTYLMEKIKFGTPAQFVIPEKEIIDFKEALIFGFLGVLRWRNEINTLSSVTGANSDNVGGCIYNPLTF
jgi:anhydro-N-acetylmuramic acid kinase